MAKTEFKIGGYYKSLLDGKNIGYTEVAQLAGVSLKTIDIFLHDRKTVSSKSLTSILDAVNKLLNSKSNTQNPIELFYVLEVEKMMRRFPKDLQEVIFDHVRSLDQFNSLRPPRVHERISN